MRARAALVLAGLSCVFGLSRQAAAAELPDAVVRVSRGPGAESCPSEAEVLSAVASQARVPPRERGPARPVVDVQMERYGESYFATLRVNGGAGGVRTLESQGATCDALRDAVVLALLVLLERDAEAPPPAAAPAALQSASPETHPAVFLSAGGAVTFGEPLRAFPALVGGAGVISGPWEFGGGFQWSPARRIQADPGTVEVQAWGFAARVCYALLSGAAARLSACGLGSVLVLRGTGSGFDVEQVQVRPWWRAGAGLEGTLPLGPRLALSAFVNGFATLNTETFSVRGLGEHYRTSGVTGQAGVELRVMLF